VNDGVANHIRALFERHGLRCTRQRQVLYEALAATKLHPTADELFQMVKSRDEGLSLATVYNTLDAFSEVGLVRRLACAKGTGPCRFDADTSDHVHLSMPDGQIRDVPEDLSQKLLEAIPPSAVEDLERRMGVRVGGLTVQVVAAPEAKVER
jgi:Fe2+ or Zn2+ uptake regulation protein